MKTRTRGILPTFTSMMENVISDDEFFAPFWRGTETVPAVNVRETDTSYQLEVAVPGMEKKDFEIEVEKGMLVIKAKREESREDKENHFTRREFSYHSFKRAFSLPENAVEDDISASYENGILKIEIKKRDGEPKPKPKSVEIS